MIFSQDADIDDVCEESESSQSEEVKPGSSHPSTFYNQPYPRNADRFVKSENIHFFEIIRRVSMFFRSSISVSSVIIILIQLVMG